MFYLPKVITPLFRHHRFFFVGCLLAAYLSLPTQVLACIPPISESNTRSAFGFIIFIIIILSTVLCFLIARDFFSFLSPKRLWLQLLCLTMILGCYFFYHLVNLARSTFIILKTAVLSTADSALQSPLAQPWDSSLNTVVYFALQIIVFLCLVGISIFTLRLYPKIKALGHGKLTNSNRKAAAKNISQTIGKIWLNLIVLFGLNLLISTIVAVLFDNSGFSTPC